MRGNEKRFVQFMHPGGEHSLKTGTKWNMGSHKRKFVRNPGKYLDNGQEKDGLLQFWTEWEAQCRLVTKITTSGDKGPRYVYEPYYSLPDNYDGLQNTDPFVFGERFYYTCCRQFVRGKAGRFNSTKVRHLAPGSVILFGSCVGKEFVLDTVFVVGSYVDYNSRNVEDSIKQRVSQVYFETTMLPIYPSLFTNAKQTAASLSCSIINERMEKDDSEKCNSINKQSCLDEGNEFDLNFRLYSGVNYSERTNFDGMFSFFPCKVYDDNSLGFARPTIKLADYITDNLALNFRSTEVNEAKAKDLWLSVVEQVEDHGLKLGIYTEMPKKEQ